MQTMKRFCMQYRRREESENGDMCVKEHGLISVVMPVGDETKYLKEAVSSIMQQSYTNWELILVSASEDREKVLSLLPKDKRIHYFYRAKNGIADALNFGIRQAAGEYIARMDADDISMPGRFEKQMDYLRSHKNVDVLGTWFIKINADGTTFEEIRLPDSHGAICMNLIFANPICHPSVMFRREVFGGENEYRKVVAEDYDLWTRLAFSHRFANLPEYLVKWRRYEDSSSSSNRKRVSDSDVQSAKKYIADRFGMDVSLYSDEAFIKNYRREELRHYLHQKKAQAVAEQITLLLEMREKCNREQSGYFAEEAKRRWLLCLNLLGCYTDSMRKLFEISVRTYCRREDLFENIAREMQIRIEKLPGTVCDIADSNFKRGKELRHMQKKFVLCGLGSDGLNALERYLSLEEAGKERWVLCGLADRKEGKIICKGKEFTVCSKRQIKDLEYDYVLISSSKYFDEIKRELIRTGISEEKILGDTILWY